MHFAFDPAKTGANRGKHGIDFEQAQALWRDPWRLRLAATSKAEPHYALVARTLDKVWFAVYTLRRGSIRIISVRRARTKEMEIYESK